MSGETIITIDLPQALEMLAEGHLPARIARRVLKIAREEIVTLRNIELAARQLADNVTDPDDPTLPTANHELIRTIRRQA